MKKFLLSISFCLISLSVFSQNTIKYTLVNLNLRSAASINGSVLTVIPKGTSVSIDKECYCTWIRVFYDGKVGYVSSKYLTKQVKKQSSVYNSNSGVKYYTNSSGERVKSPTHYNSHPAGATALCRDGTYSFSRNRRGTCSHHGGVAQWF
jgi:uncharacterized protein YgiM (DUF1202 family)